jgi:hypothetical protein
VRIGKARTVEVEFGGATLSFSMCAGLAAVVAHLQGLLANAVSELGDDASFVALLAGVGDDELGQVLSRLGDLLDGWQGVEDEDGKPLPAGPSEWQAFCGHIGSAVPVFLLMFLEAAANAMPEELRPRPDPTPASSETEDSGDSENSSRDEE